MIRGLHFARSWSPASQAEGCHVSHVFGRISPNEPTCAPSRRRHAFLQAAPVDVAGTRTIRLVLSSAAKHKVRIRV